MDSRYIEELISEDIQSLGCAIWGIELSGRIISPTLRIFIDKDSGISIEDCEKVSKHISKVLDAKSDLNRNFSLEVSSPGMERKFFKNSQYTKYLNYPIKVRYISDDEAFITKKGILEEVREGGLVLKSHNEYFFIGFDSIEKANLEIAKE
tara:strand:- start:421 stop:873 length:453 start_codon:yes stop_codon:yes gene_type:complete